jgi:hypothetical protein
MDCSGAVTIDLVDVLVRPGRRASLDDAVATKGTYPKRDCNGGVRVYTFRVEGR